MKKKIMMSLCLIFTSPVYAIINSNIEKEFIPKQTCNLIFYAKIAEGFVPASLCSGTVTSSKTFTTAAHCTDQLSLHDGALIVCPENKMHPIETFKDHPSHSYIDEYGLSKKDQRYDVSVIKIKNEFDIEAINLPDSSASVTKDILNADSCLAAGYGQDEAGNFFNLKAFKINQFNLTGHGIHIPYDPSKPNIGPGDSGGPLYCSISNEWKLYGINTAMTNIRTLEENLYWLKLTIKELDESVSSNEEQLNHCLADLELNKAQRDYDKSKAITSLKECSDKLYYLRSPYISKVYQVHHPKKFYEIDNDTSFPPLEYLSFVVKGISNDILKGELEVKDYSEDKCQGEKCISPGKYPNVSIHIGNLRKVKLIKH